jgi:hypothetical protein
MIFAESLLAVGLLYYAIQRKIIEASRLLFPLTLICFAFSILPSLSIPYIFDDVDHFHDLAQAIRGSHVVGWLLTPHNEHVIPLIKGIYYLCYRCFWLEPEMFHGLVIAVCLGNLWLLYKLLYAFTNSGPAALIGACIVAATNLTDDAIFVGTNAHIFFCMFFFLLLFYAIHQYGVTRKAPWRLVAFVAILLAPSTFALGLTSIGFVVLFGLLCLSPEQRQASKPLLPLLLVGWLLSLAPYLNAVNGILHADHYRNVGRDNVLQAAHLVVPLKFLLDYVGAILIPSIFANRYLAFGVFFLCALAVVNYAADIPWKKVGFFACFGLFNNFIIYVFRSAWGTASFDTGRYYVFPVIMMAICYPLILSAYLNKEATVKGVSTVLLSYLVCCFAVSYGGLTRFNKSTALLEETNIMSALYVDFRKTFEDYLRDTNASFLEVKNGRLEMPGVYSIAKKGSCPMSRFPRTREFYATYVLPVEINNRIVWSGRTDPGFSDYVKRHKVKFLVDSDL